MNRQHSSKPFSFRVHPFYLFTLCLIRSIESLAQLDGSHHTRSSFLSGRISCLLPGCLDHKNKIKGSHFPWFCFYDPNKTIQTGSGPWNSTSRRILRLKAVDSGFFFVTSKWMEFCLDLFVSRGRMHWRKHPLFVESSKTYLIEMYSS